MTEQKLAILWDMDGTIFDTKECHYATWVYALEKFGFNLRREVYDANFGRNNKTLIPLLLGFQPEESLVNALIDEKEGYFRQIAPEEIALVPGVESWLIEVKQAQIPQAVASSAPMENITTLLSSFNLQHYFNAFVSGASLAAKPEPDVFLETAKILGRSPKNCVVVEDAIPGVKAAINAGMTCIAVSTTCTIADLLLADHVVKDFTKPLSEILNYLGFGHLPSTSA